MGTLTLRPSKGGGSYIMGLHLFGRRLQGLGFRILGFYACGLRFNGFGRGFGT